MAINNPLPTSQVRQPRPLAVVGGQPAAGLVQLEVDNNNLYQADTFRATFALSAQPANRGMDWWASQTDIDCELFAGLPPDPARFTKADLTSFILGQVDQVEVDVVKRLVHLSGRDYTAKLIDAQTSEKFQNLTASQIAQQLAARHGLAAVVTPTTTRAGTFYQIDHDRLTDKRTEWDLLCYLAREEDLVVYVRGKTLYMQPRPQATDAPYVLRYVPPTAQATAQGNFKNLTLERALTISKGVVVKVKTWNHKQKKGFVAAYPRNVSSTTGSAANSAKAPQVYEFTRPALSQQQALAYAQQKYHEIVSHEMKLNVDLPGDALLTCQNVIQLTGTGSAFDQVYFPSNVHRYLDWQGGFRMRVQAKNHSTETETSA